MSEEVTIQCDASEKGLGATLMQNGQPIAFASRALSNIEQAYAQIEKECMSILFACERFDQYLHGRDLVTVTTDHKPLVPIFAKPIFGAPKRLQRMLLRLQKYRLQVKFCPGNKMHIADMLSRAYLNDMGKQKPAEYHIFQMQQEENLFKEIESINQIEYIRISDATHQEIRKHTQRDETLQELLTTILKGWPDKKEEVPACIRMYWGYRDEITVQNGVLFKGPRVVVPRSLQAEMLVRTHASHQGAEASIRRAREVIFWPGMTAEIKQQVSQCAVCSEYSAKQQKEPLMTYELPSRPWKMVAQDLFTWDQKDFLITVDYYSDYWELDELADTTSLTVIDCTKKHFARYGVPDRVITDNGPQFRSQEYEKFAATWKFEHTTSSPYHSQSNGKAESAVKIAKKLLQKSKKDHRDVQLAILDWRNTPTESSNVSPSQKFHSRRTRTLLPTAEPLLMPEVPNNVQEAIELRRQKAKFYYDKGAKTLPNLTIGQPVRIQPLSKDGSWKKATTVNVLGNRSYTVQTEEGQRYRRNRKFIRPAEKQLIPVVSPEPQSDPDNQIADSPEEGDTQRQNDMTNSPSDNAVSATTNQTVTSRGRVVKLPDRLTDYVKH